MQDYLGNEELTFEDFKDALKQVCSEADTDGNNEVSMDEFVQYLQEHRNPRQSWFDRIVYPDGNEIAEDIVRTCDLCEPPKLFIFCLTTLMIILGLIE